MREITHTMNVISVSQTRFQSSQGVFRLTRKLTPKRIRLVLSGWGSRPCSGGLTMVSKENTAIHVRNVNVDACLSLVLCGSYGREKHTIT